MSAALTKLAIPSSAPRFDFTFDLTKLSNQSIPPLCWIIPTRPPISNAIIAISSIPIIPLEIAFKRPFQPKEPSISPIIPANTVPPINTIITLIPTNARIKTNKYGMTLIKL